MAVPQTAQNVQLPCAMAEMNGVHAAGVHACVTLPPEGEGTIPMAAGSRCSLAPHPELALSHAVPAGCRRPGS